MGAEQAFYKDPESLQAAVNAYFAHCDTVQYKRLTKKGDEVITSEPYTVEGLALHLGFESARSLLNYENRNNGKVWAAPIVRRAKTRIGQQVNIWAMLGIIDSHVARLNLMTNHGYSEKAQSEFILTDDRIGDDERALLKDAAKHLAEQRKSLPMTTVSPDMSD